MAEVFQIKLIQARKLAIAPVRLEILNALRAEGREVAKEYQKTTASWQGKKPRFESQISLTRTESAVLTGPTGDAEAVKKWTRLDEGVPPSGRIIRPVTPGVKALRFRGGPYKAKTKPGLIGSGAGGGTGAFIYRKWARHLPHGIQARQWSETIQKRRRKRFTRRIVKAMQRGMKKAPRR